MTRFEVRDFGPLAEASVELKPLTMFIGPNNSGKSYLALAMYSLSRTLADDSPIFGPGRVRRSRHSEPEFDEHDLIQARDAMKQVWPEGKPITAEPIELSELPSKVRHLLQLGVNEAVSILALDFSDELKRCFGTPISLLGRKGSGDGASKFGVTVSKDLNGMRWHMSSKREEVLTTSFDSRLPKLALSQNAEFMTWFITGHPDYLGFAIGEIAHGSLSAILHRAHYMPASRSGILLGHKTLASLIVGRSSTAWIEPMEIPRLPGVITDMIQALLLLEPAGRVENEIQEVVGFLEGKVSRGVIDIDRLVEYPEIYYENDTGKYQLHQVASMVSEVAPIVLYLKYLVRQGHIFIIEEPESHLDAHSQRNLARALAMLVNAGVQVLVTTHSDYFVSQINNLLLLSELTARQRAGRRYARSEVLEPGQVGAYYFRPTDDGTRVDNLEVTAAEGIPTDMFTDVHSALYNEAVTLEHARPS